VVRRFRIGPSHFGAGFGGCEHPFDAGTCGIALLLPDGGFGGELVAAFDASVEALAGQDADLDLDHVQPTGMLGDVVELQSAQHPSGFVSREGLIERAGRMCRQIVEHHPDALCLEIMDIGQFAHACGKVLRGAPFSDLHLAPGAVHIEEDEQVRRPVAPILAVVALDLPRLGRDRLAHLADELDGALVEADDRPLIRVSQSPTPASTNQADWS
jgi:hypothetical protein